MNLITTCDTVTYVLKLEDNKWYIGKSMSLKKRLKQHWSGKGARWTAKHKPVELVQLYAGDVEKEKTQYAMAKYGKENVRGYGFTKSV